MKIVVPAVMLSIAAGSVAGQNPLQTRNACRLSIRSWQKPATEFMANQQTIGLSIGIYKDNNIDTYNFGSTEAEATPQPPTAQTLYAIASITKTFTGTLLAQAVVNRKANLEDDVRKHLDGDFPNLQI